MSHVILDADHDAFFTRIMPHNMMRIGEKIHRKYSQKSFIPKTERYFPATEVSDVARNMSVPSIRSIPHAIIF